MYCSFSGELSLTYINKNINQEYDKEESMNCIGPAEMNIILSFTNVRLMCFLLFICADHGPGYIWNSAII